MALAMLVIGAYFLATMFLPAVIRDAGQVYASFIVDGAETGTGSRPGRMAHARRRCRPWILCTGKIGDAVMSEFVGGLETYLYVVSTGLFCPVMIALVILTFWMVFCLGALLSPPFTAQRRRSRHASRRMRRSSDSWPS